MFVFVFQKKRLRIENKKLSKERVIKEIVGSSPLGNHTIIN